MKSSSKISLNPVVVDVGENNSQRILNGAALWASYYRSNPHRFVEDYLHVHLKLFQKILIFMMNSCYFFMYIASRG